MKRVLSLAACAALTLTSACGGEAPSQNEVQADVNEALNDASAAINEAEMATENVAEAIDAPPPPTSEGSAPVEPTVAPPPPPASKDKAVPAAKAEPKRPAPPKAPSEPKAPAADPHAGHDMSNMSHGNMSH